MTPALPPEVWQPLGAIGAAAVGGFMTLLGKRLFGKDGQSTDTQYLWTELRKAREDATYWYNYAQQLQRINDAMAHHAAYVQLAVPDAFVED